MKRSNYFYGKSAHTLRLICLLFMLFFTFALYAQDIIVQTDSTKIEAVIREISENEVKYKRFSNQSGPDYVIRTFNIAYIRYQNGEIDRFIHQQTAETNIRTIENNNFQDSKDYPMSRKDRSYYLNGKQLTTKEFEALIEGCAVAKKFYNRNTIIGGVGAFLIFAGVSCEIMGLIGLGNPISTAVLVAGGLFETAGVPMCCVGFIRRKYVFERYNKYCAKTANNDINKCIRIDLQATGNGLGMAVKF